jgi:hypothetical protein
VRPCYPLVSVCKVGVALRSGLDMRMAGILTGARGLLAGTDHSVAERMRRRRWHLFYDEFPALEEMNIVDFGGTAWWWDHAPVRPRHVTIINLAEPDSHRPWVTYIQGDACRGDELLNGEAFDLAFSNSLIEHVGGHQPRAALATVITKAAPRFYVQTPYRYFPIEPHWMLPGFQFLPVNIRSWLAPRWPMGHTYGWPASHAAEEVMGTDLISATDMRRYFPGSKIVYERFLGLRKSLIAIG